MPSSSLVLASAFIVSVCALPVDDISARNGIGSSISGPGGQASGGSVSAASNNCTSPTSCHIFNESLLKVASENAGDGGSAFSGTSNGKKTLTGLARTNSTGKIPVGSGFSGAGGEAPGGFVVDNRPAFVELDSDNAGHGGNASSGDSSGLVS